ncbi:ankyrin repeat-containing domain protein, partial [Mycena latifolia]
AAKAGNTEIAALLLDAGANPRAAYSFNQYQALHLATKNEHLSMVQLLLDHGASPNDYMGGLDRPLENCLHFACKRGNLDIVQLLWWGANMERGYYGAALGYAVHYKLDVAEFLLSVGANAKGTIPLFVLDSFD